MGYELAITTDTCNLVAASQVELPSGALVAPGGQVAFDILLSVPANGPCSLGVRMIQSGGIGLFGQPLTMEFNIVPAVNDALMISNTLPATMAPNQTTGYSFTIRNTGNTAWFVGSNHALAVIGSPCMIPATTRVAPQPDIPIMPGQNFVALLWMTAPATTGPCNIDVQMIEELVEFFGQTLNTSINIQVPPNASRDWSAYE